MGIYTLREPLTIEFNEGDEIYKMLEKAESSIIEHVLKDSKYNQSATARKLGVSRMTVRTRLKTYFGDKYL